MVTQDFPPEYGGIQTYSYEHARRLYGQCGWFGLICPDKPGAPAVDEGLDFPVYRIKTRNELLILPLLRKLPGLLTEHSVDAMFHSQWQTAAASIRARNRGRIKKVFVAAHIRELLFNPYEKLPGLGRAFERYKKWVLREADHFYPVSDYTAGQLKKLGVEDDRLTVVINGTDPERFHPVDVRELKKELGLGRKKILLTITRLVPRKGIDTVLMALAHIRKEIPDIHHLIVGDGPDRSRLENLAKELSLTEQVTFTGRIPYEMLNRYYNLGDLFVMPSRTRIPDVEGFGIVFLEANSCGLPVIGSDSGGIPSAILHGETGLIIPEGDAGILARETIRLFKDEKRMHKLGDQGRKRVLREANWDVLSARLFTDMKARMNL